MSNYISQFKINGMWGRVDLQWDNINPDVNIIVGINGCGKTTLLNLIYDYYNGTCKPKKGIASSIEGNKIDVPVSFLKSFDVPANGKRKTESLLLQELKNTINQNGEGTSFFDYRMKILNFPDLADKINARISNFFATVNALFIETGKAVTIDKSSNSIAFTIRCHKGVLRDDEGTPIIASSDNRGGAPEDLISLDQLSSGEKQMLLILTTVFLQEEKPCVLLMDEPEISLHISWQDKLVEMIRRINPNCQLILTTHSPNIFTNGWEDKITFIEDLEI